MTGLSRGLLLATLAFALGACCTTTTPTNDGGSSSGGASGGGSTGDNGCINMGSCYGVAKCPAGSSCDENTFVCCAYAGSNGGNGNAGNGSGGSGNAGSASSGLSGSGSASATASNGGSGASAGSTGNSAGASSGGETGGSGSGSAGNGGVGLVAGSCADGGVCPPGSTCNTNSWLCMGAPAGTAGSTGSYFWSGTAGLSGGSAGEPVGTCNDGGVCPKNSVCNPNTHYCVANPSASSGGIFGGNAGGNGGSSGGGAACSPTAFPDPCLPQGLICSPQSDTCVLPTTGQPCEASVGCQGGGVTCIPTTDGQSHICETQCTNSSQCAPLTQTCQFNAAFDGGTCQGNPCGDFFSGCNASGSNDGSCLLPPAATIFNCPQQADGCGSCMQGGNVADGDPCDTTRGTNFCQPGSVCTTSPSGDSSTMCAPMCSPWNGPTLCPYGYGCYWPLGSNLGVCLLLCPVDPLCPFSIGGDTPGGCSNCNFGASILTGGTVCVMDCPGSSYCQFIPGTPVPACLP